MDKNHQDKTNSKLIATEDELWLPPSFTRNTGPVASSRERMLRNKQKQGSTIKRGFVDRTVWDWLNLLGVLAIPFVVSVIGLSFTQQFTQQQAQLSERQHQTDLQIAEDQQRQTTLITCIDEIRDLLLNKGLKTSQPNDEIRVVARAQVLSTLRQLDGARKGLLVRFLSQAGLVTDTVNGNNVIIDLTGANLADADLGSTTPTLNLLQDRGLITIPLNNVDLTDARLADADLRGGNLRGASLTEANLGGADLTVANLSDADLGGADLIGARLDDANLRSASLDLAELNKADLRGADLGDADLSGADLRDATMPDGSKHP